MHRFCLYSSILSIYFLLFCADVQEGNYVSEHDKANSCDKLARDTDQWITYEHPLFHKIQEIRIVHRQKRIINEQSKVDNVKTQANKSKRAMLNQSHKQRVSLVLSTI